MSTGQTDVDIPSLEDLLSKGIVSDRYKTGSTRGERKITVVMGTEEVA